MILNKSNIASLTTGLKAVFNKAFAEAQPIYPKIATIVPSGTSAEDYSWLGADLKMREWQGERVAQNLKNYSYSIKNKSFELTVAVKKTDIEDDQYGQYNPLIADMGNAAKMYPDDLVFDLLKNGTTRKCYDGQYFFDTDHDVGGTSVSNYTSGTNAAWYLLDCSRPVKPFLFQNRKNPEFVAKDEAKDDNVFFNGDIVYGIDARGNAGYGLWPMAYCSKAELTTANFDTAYAAMRSYKGANGHSLGIRPTLLVVPPSLRGKAGAVIQSQKLSGDVDNHNYNIVEIVEAAELA